MRTLLFVPYPVQAGIRARRTAFAARVLGTLLDLLGRLWPGLGAAPQPVPVPASGRPKPTPRR